METDFLIVGSGIMGLAIARNLGAKYPDSRVLIIEKENEAAQHASGRNSGVLHAGFYYDADSLKAKFTVEGNKAMTEYCLENGIHVNRCGKVVVASNEEEIEGIYELKRRGDANGVKLDLINEYELNRLEPNARTCSVALFSPTTSSVNPKKVCRHILSHLPANVSIRYNTALTGCKKNAAVANNGTIRFKHLFNAAGLYADKAAKLFGVGSRYTMMPFKGIYLECLDRRLIKRHVYPVPNLKNPFLGVHFTITSDGHIKIGPTAIPAFWRENYDFSNRFKFDEFFEIIFRQSLLFIGNSFNFRGLAFEEIQKYNRKNFINQSKKLVKRLNPESFGDYLPSGIRAQLMDIDTHRLVMDFIVEYGENSTHLLNSVSPAFTTSFTFADHVVKETEARFKM